MNLLIFQPAGAMLVGKHNAPRFSGQHHRNSSFFLRITKTLQWFRKGCLLSDRGRHMLFLILWIAGCMMFAIPTEGRSLQKIKRSGKLYIGLTHWDYSNINYPLAL